MMESIFPLYYTAFLLLSMTIVLINEWIEAEVAIFGTLILLLLGNVITVKEAFAGFSNVGVLTIGLLFIVAGSLQTTGALNTITPLLLGDKPVHRRRRLLRILFPVSTFSAFLNNTPIVALFIPLVRSWTEKYNMAPSKFFIPISYAAILGGMCTLIGTSTNLVIHGMLIENGERGFAFFEISKIGFPVMLIGLLFLIIAGYKLLPDRKEPLVELGETTREFVCELKITKNYEHIGKSIEQAGLRHLKGLFLFQIERNGKIIAPAGPDEKLQLHDRLFFTGIPKTIVELQKTPGLQVIKDSVFDLKNYDADVIKTYEAVVSPSSPLVGRNVRESNFRGKYGAVIIAIHRNGERIQKKIGDIVLRSGDTLLLLAEQGFMKKWYHSNDFYLISDTARIYSKPVRHARLASIVFVGMVAMAASQFIPLIAAAGLAALLLILSRSISPSDAKNMIEWRVLIIIAGAFGIARAIQNSGLAEAISNGMMSLVQPLGIIGILSGIYVLTSVYNCFITSNAAAAFLFPVALSTALNFNIDIRPMAMTVTIAAAASFATPIGYQTNLMVYSPGGYKFSDYLRIGIPMQILTGIFAIAIIYFIYF